MSFGELVPGLLDFEVVEVGLPLVREAVFHFKDDCEFDKIDEHQIGKINTIDQWPFSAVAGVLALIFFLTHIFFFLDFKHVAAETLFVLVEVQQMLFLLDREHSFCKRSLNLIYINWV